MSIQQTVILTVAEAYVTDDYRVEVRIEPGTTFSPDEAAQLADEIYHAATEAATKYRKDQPRAEHGFDVSAPPMTEAEIREWDDAVGYGEE